MPLRAHGGLAGGQIAAPAGAEREIFETHLLPWIGRFFADLERAESADFYAGVGAVGRTFVDIETKAFTLTPDLNSGFKKEDIFQWLGVPDRGLSTTASRPAGQPAGCGFGSGIS